MRSFITLFGRVFENHKKAAALFVLMLSVFWGQAQTDQIVNNGTSGPPCPGGGSGVLRLTATCNTAPTQVTVNDEAGNPVYTNTFPGTSGDVIQGVPEGRYIARLSCNSADKGNFTFQVGSPTPTIVIGQQGSPGSVTTVCNSSSLTLTLTGTTPSNGTTVLWSGPGTIANTAASSTTVTNIPSGANQVYTYKWTKSGCTDLVTTSSPITIVEPPQLSPVTDAETCDGSDTSPIQFTNTNNLTGVTYSWSNSKPSIGLAGSGTGNIPSFTAANTTGILITAVITAQGSANGCSGAQITFNIKVYPRLTTSLSSNKVSYCSGEDIILTLTTNISGTYTWTGPNSFSNTTSGNNKVVTVSPSVVASSGTYTTLVNVGSSQCSQSATTTVSVTQGPGLVINNPVACSGQVVDLMAPAVTQGTTGAAGLALSYWFDAGATAAIPNPRQITSNGTYYIKANDGTCAVTKPVTVTFGNPPQITVTNPAPVCEGAAGYPVNLSGTFTPESGVTYTYWKDQAATTQIQSNPPTIATLGTTTAYIKGARNSGGCATVVPVTVKINARPVMTVRDPAFVCNPPPSGTAQVDICATAITAGTTPVDGVSSTNNPYSYWTDAACTQSAGTPLYNSSTNTYSLKLPNPYPTPTDIQKHEYIYYIKAKKSYPGNGNASACTSVGQVTITVAPKPVITLQNLDNSLKTSLCDTEKRDLRDFPLSNITGTTFQFYSNAAMTTLVGTPTSVGAGTYYVKGTTTDGCSSAANQPVTIRLFAKPAMLTQDASVCYDPSTNSYFLGNGVLVVSFAGDGGSLHYSNVRDSYADDYPNENILLPAGATEYNTGILQKVIWVQGYKTYSYNYNATIVNQTRKCYTNSDGRRFTVKPLPRISLPFPPPARHDFLCNGGKTNIVPRDDNAARYPNLGSPFTRIATYYWTALETNRQGVPNGQDIISGEADQPANPTPSTKKIQQILNLASSSPFGYVRYTITATMNGCISQNTVTMDVPIVSNPAPLVNDNNQLHMCGGTVYKLDNTVDNTDYSNTTPPVNRPAFNKAPVPLTATATENANVYFNWTSVPIANAAGYTATGNTSYTTKPGTRVSQVPSGGTEANAGFIEDMLINNSPDDAVVEYSVLPYLFAADENGDPVFCLGGLGTSTVTVHPVPILTPPAGSVSVCDNSGVNIDLNSDKNTTLYYWNHSPNDPNQLGGVEDYQPTLSSPNNVPQDETVFRSQILDNKTSASYTVSFNITPNTGYNNFFGGCNGLTKTVSMTVLNHHAPVFSTPPALMEVCANVSGAVNNNVSIPLNSTVNTDTGPLSPLTGPITYTWDIGGDYIARNYGPNGEDWKYFGDAFAANTAPVNGPGPLTANLILQGGNASDLALRQTTDRGIYYTITPTYDGCAGSAVRVNLTMHPDPYITELDKLGTEQVCNGQEASFNVKSYYPDDQMNYTWHVLTRQEQLNQGKPQTNPFYPVSSTGTPGSVDGLLQATPVGGRFYFKDNVAVDVELEFEPHNTRTNCRGPKRPIVVTVQPKPTAQAVGSPAEICLSEFCVLNLSSPAQVVADPPLSVADTKFKWEPVDYDPNLSVVSTTYDYASTSLANRVTNAGPIIDQWKLTSNTTPLTSSARARYMILPFLNACQGDTVYTEVTIYPLPNAILATPLNANGTCSGAELEVKLGTSPEVQGVKYRWEAAFDASLIQGMSSRSDPSDSPIVQTITTTSIGQVESTYKIVPTVAYDPSSNLLKECVGDTLKVRVLTNPLPSLEVAEADPPVICSESSGKITLNHTLGTQTVAVVKYQWEVAGGADVTGYVSPKNNIDEDTKGIPTSVNYELLTNNASTEQSIFFIARAKAIYQQVSTSAGVECMGPSRNVKVKVAPQPKMKQPGAPPKFCSHDNVYIVLENDNRPGTFFTWATDADGISGMGVGSYTSTNQGSENIGPIEGELYLQGEASGSQRAIYTITPHIRIRPDGENGEGVVCNAPTTDYKTVTVLVGAVPTLETISPVVVCSGTENVQINFRTTPTDATVAWSNDNVDTGLALSGTSSIPSFTAAINETNRDFVSNILITPTSSEQCSGASQAATLTVRMAPTVGAAADNNYVCSAAPQITLTNPNNLQGTTYQWRVTVANATNADGTAVASQEDTNPATAPTKFTSPALIPGTIQPGTVVYSFRALGANGCVGRPLEPPITITVNPVPQGESSPPGRQDVCSGDKTFITLQGRQGVPGGSIPAKYTWRVANVDNAKGFTEASTEKTIAQISENVTVIDPLKFGSFVYYITPHAFGCAGDEFSVEVKLIPGLMPLKTNPVNTSFCVGDNVTLTSEPNGEDITYQWYLSSDSNSTWGQVQNEPPYSGANTQNLTITNIPAKFHNRLFKVEISGKTCPSLKLFSTSAQLTEWLAGAAIEASPGTTPLVGEAIKYTYSGPTEGTTYAWDFGDGWASSSQNPVHYYYTRGTYETHVEVRKQSCTKDLYLKPILVKGPDYLGEIVTNNESLHKGVLTYPVPFGDYLVIESPDVISKVIISSMQGIAVMSEEVSGKKATLSTTALATGVYVVTIKHESGATRIKVVKY